MPTPPLTDKERSRRKATIEKLLKEGYHPQGSSGGIASATKEAERREGVNFPRWVRWEEQQRDDGRPDFAVDWSLYVAPASGASDDEKAVVTPEVHAQTRATFLSTEITRLVTSSKFPLVNPDAIVIDHHLVRKYDRGEQSYVWVEGVPRTWLTDTLKVASIPDARGRKFIFSSAQNDAEVHPVLKNLEAYAAWLGAEVVIGPLTYETQWWSENNPAARAYAPELQDYLCFGQMQIGDNFIFAGEMNTLPTASQPVSDLVTYSRSRWAVFPHQKRQLKSVPSTDPNTQAHQVMTTGSVTRPKVVPRKAGIKSIFHAVAGAVIVEFDQDGDVFCRQITADDEGSFYDLDRYVKNAEVTTGHRVSAIVCGDLHLRKLDGTNALATFGFDLGGGAARYRDSIIDVLKPEHVLLHDIFDNEARNHHHEDDNAYSYEMAVRGRDSVLNEISGVASFLAKIQDPSRNVIVVESNHDIGLERYVREGRYRNDGINVRLGLQLEDRYLQFREEVGHALDSGEKPESFSLLEYAVRVIQKDLDRVEWVHDGYSRLIDGIEVGHHGFRGVNGAKGTIAGYARVGRKMTIADKHTPEINEGVYVAGCMNLRHGYNKGPSSWAVSHVVHYPDGSRAILTLQKGKWRSERPRISMPARIAA